LVELNHEDVESLKHSVYGYGNGSIELTLVYQPNEVLFPKEIIDIGAKIRWGYPDDSLQMVQLADKEWRELAQRRNWRIDWKLYADNMPSKQGIVNLWELTNMQ
jgi:hypothetical protein